MSAASTEKATDAAVKAVFAAAEKRLKLVGWCKGHQSGQNPGADCIALAVQFFQSGDVLTAAEKRLCDELGVASISDVWEWNDAPERTKEEVYAVLQKLAA